MHNCYRRLTNIPQVSRKIVDQENSQWIKCERNVYLVFLVITPSFSAITIHRFIFLFYLIQIMILFFNPLQVDCYTRIERNCLWRSNPVNCVHLKLAIYFIIIFKPIMQIYKSIWSPD